MTRRKQSTAARWRAALRSANRHERAEAAVRLGQAGDRDALGPLRAMADDPDDLVAVAAYYAIWCIEQKLRGVDRLVAALASDEEQTMQLAVEALCRIGQPAVPALVQALEGESSFKVRIVRILGEIGGEPAMRAVAKAQQSADPAVARQAREVLAQD